MTGNRIYARFFPPAGHFHHIGLAGGVRHRGQAGQFVVGKGEGGPIRVGNAAQQVKGVIGIPGKVFGTRWPGLIFLQ
ncbi:hypothetical protein [Photorhabdus khanii]|uniref:hypothetical protein n=1 Tax=Photorhabdus khanii TaxID=1004150 RepID=UPI001EF01B23|nr:hypothetical protein [Photorhabdus khanii]